jgi:phage terminase large subunit-like protein
MTKALAQLSADELRDHLRLVNERLAKKAEVEKMFAYTPYPKQREFHAAGLKYRERLFSAGNQLGKTYAGAAEMAFHLTGQYPKWWKGKVWTRPISAIAGSESGELTRDGVQRLLVGEPSVEEMWGTGLIPRDAISAPPKRRSGVKDAIDAVTVRHVSGGVSVCRFKSFDQGRTKWQASTLDYVWMDEEPPFDVYEEAVTRTNATGGIVAVTFTPLKGMSKVVMRFFLEPGNGRHVVTMTIDDVDHYTPERRAEIIASYDDATRDARTRGVPVLGSGRVFPVPDEMVKIDPIHIPEHWAMIGGLDFGWDHPTAAVQLAWDRDTDTIYVMREYRVSRQTPAIHAASLRMWEHRLPWAWPHDGQSHDKGSGEQLAEQYRRTGMNMLHAHATFENGSNSLEAGVLEMLTRMNEGRLKVFSNCQMWFSEFNLYHRKDGKIVMLNDDLLSATRYAMMMRRFAQAVSRRGAWGDELRRPTKAKNVGAVRR